MTTKDLRSDLQADLLADLAPPLTDAPTTPQPMPLPAELAEATPSVCVQWTPLRWSRPRVVRAEKGAGKAVKVGPLKIELSVHDLR